MNNAKSQNLRFWNRGTPRFFEGPGAPKFLKNWLRSASNTYEADHIFPKSGCAWSSKNPKMARTDFSPILGFFAFFHIFHTSYNNTSLCY